MATEQIFVSRNVIFDESRFPFFVSANTSGESQKNGETHFRLLPNNVQPPALLPTPPRALEPEQINDTNCTPTTTQTEGESDDSTDESFSGADTSTQTTTQLYHHIEHDRQMPSRYRNFEVTLPGGKPKTLLAQKSKYGQKLSNNTNLIPNITIKSIYPTPNIKPDFHPQSPVFNHSNSIPPRPNIT